MFQRRKATLQWVMYHLRGITHHPHSSISPAKRERISNGLLNVLERECAQSFVAPVSLEDYPSYMDIIAHPMNLLMITERVNTGYYRTVEVGSPLTPGYHQRRGFDLPQLLHLQPRRGWSRVANGGPGAKNLPNRLPHER